MVFQFDIYFQDSVIDMSIADIIKIRMEGVKKLMSSVGGISKISSRSIAILHVTFFALKLVVQRDQ
jgi:hypothetical protein